MTRIWIAGLLLCGLGTIGIAVGLCMLAVNGMEVRLPPDQQTQLDRALAGPEEVSRQLEAVRHALEVAQQRAEGIHASFERLVDIVEPLRTDKNIDEAESVIAELRAGLRRVSEELSGLREDISVMRPLMPRGR